MRTSQKYSLISTLVDNSEPRRNAETQAKENVTAYKSLVSTVVIYA